MTPDSDDIHTVRDFTHATPRANGLGVHGVYGDEGKTAPLCGTELGVWLLLGGGGSGAPSGFPGHEGTVP